MTINVSLISPVLVLRGGGHFLPTFFYQVASHIVLTDSISTLLSDHLIFEIKFFKVRPLKIYSLRTNYTCI